MTRGGSEEQIAAALLPPPLIDNWRQLSIAVHYNRKESPLESLKESLLFVSRPGKTL